MHSQLWPAVDGTVDGKNATMDVTTLISLLPFVVVEAAVDGAGERHKQIHDSMLVTTKVAFMLSHNTTTVGMQVAEVVAEFPYPTSRPSQAMQVLGMT